MEELYCQLRILAHRVTTLLDTSLDYNETHFQKVLIRELQNCKMFSEYQVSEEVVIPYQLDDGFVFGYGRADIILLNAKRCIIIELKAGVTIKQPQLKKYKAQVRKYCKHFNSDVKKYGVVIIFNPLFLARHFKMEITEWTQPYKTTFGFPSTWRQAIIHNEPSASVKTVCVTSNNLELCSLPRLEFFSFNHPFKHFLTLFYIIWFLKLKIWQSS